VSGRDLAWEGCVNARDLGGLPTADGRTVRFGAIVRSDHLNRLTAAGWTALWDHGVRTVVDLRDSDERQPNIASRPPGLATIEIPLEDLSDTAFWREWRRFCCTPLYYRAFLDRAPERVSRIVAAIADAAPGVVVVHCGHGRDRTGLISLVLLSLVGVSSEAIAADYALSADRLRPLLAQLGRANEEIIAQRHLRVAGLSAEAAVVAALAGFDAEACLLDGGLRPDPIARLRDRLLG
jgi:protein-tyrosine phosphatase